MCGAGCGMFDAEDEQEIALAEVPDAVMKAAQGAVEGIVLTEAEMEQEDGRVVYEVEGMADGQEYEMEITAAGEVLEVEREDGDDDEEEDNDDD